MPTYSLSLNVFSGKSESLSAHIFTSVYMCFQEKVSVSLSTYFSLNVFPVKSEVSVSLSTCSIQFKCIFRKKWEPHCPHTHLIWNVFSGIIESVSVHIFTLVYMFFQGKVKALLSTYSLQFTCISRKEWEAHCPHSHFILNVFSAKIEHLNCPHIHFSLHVYPGKSESLFVHIFTSVYIYF